MSKVRKILNYFPPEVQENIISKSRRFRLEFKSLRWLVSYYILWLKWRKSKKMNQSLGFNEVESVKKRTKHEIVIENPIKLQSMIDSLSYPPTHEYSVKDLKPKGELKIRLAQMKTVSPNFFEGDNFLDIGCNKGFFSLLASQNFLHVKTPKYLYDISSHNIPNPGSHSKSEISGFQKLDCESDTRGPVVLRTFSLRLRDGSNC